MPDGGWVLPVSLAAPTVPGPGQILGSWLPVGVGSSGLVGGGGPGDNIDIHLVWSSVAALGLGLVVQSRRPQRWLAGLLLVALAGADPAAVNTQTAGAPAHGLAAPLNALRKPA